jgi:TRIAD3 protein (E3 ubiquitin-protein ligase RNF216)
MNQCLAITKKGSQCSKNKSQDAKLFCGIHNRSHPNKIILEGTDKIIDFTDVNVYQTMLDKFNLENEERINTETLIARELEEEKLFEYLNSKSCTVCGDETPLGLSELITCSNSGIQHQHINCKMCLKGHILSLIGDGIASLECMFNKHDKCGGEYTEYDIRKALEYDDASFAKWQDLFHTSEIIKLAGICENYIICPLCCKWGCIFDVPVGSEKLGFGITCSNCKKQWCTLCKRAWHHGRICYELVFTEKEDKIEKQTEIIDKMIHDIATRALTHCCSICGCQYIKEEGCNLMTCPKCYGMSCFICSMKLYYKGDTKYWHFTGHDKSDPNATCPLWNNHVGDGKANQGNTEFNIKAIDREFWNFINSNLNNKMVTRLICSRIIKIYDKDKQFTDTLKNIRKFVH